VIKEKNKRNLAKFYNLIFDEKRTIKVGYSLFFSVMFRSEFSEIIFLFSGIYLLINNINDWNMLFHDLLIKDCISQFWQ
jgi:hypothetical protein